MLGIAGASSQSHAWEGLFGNNCTFFKKGQTSDGVVPSISRVPGGGKEDAA